MHSPLYALRVFATHAVEAGEDRAFCSHFNAVGSDHSRSVIRSSSGSR
jgi:hypothetical protein